MMAMTTNSSIKVKAGPPTHEHRSMPTASFLIVCREVPNTTRYCPTPFPCQDTAIKLPFIRIHRKHALSRIELSSSQPLSKFMARAFTALLLLTALPQPARRASVGLCGSTPAFASGHSHSSKSRSSKTYGASSKSHTSSSAIHKSTYAQGVERNSHGRIARSEAAKDEFMKMTGHPKGWPGHIVDHIVPLKRGGADNPGNMQWQTEADAKAKDKWE
jgi:hypothetical protein